MCAAYTLVLPAVIVGVSYKIGGSPNAILAASNDARSSVTCTRWMKIDDDKAGSVNVLGASTASVRTAFTAVRNSEMCADCTVVTPEVSVGSVKMTVVARSVLLSVESVEPFDARTL